MGFWKRDTALYGGLNDYGLTTEKHATAAHEFSVRDVGHLCWPPELYPKHAGPGTLFRCGLCGVVWRAVGIRPSAGSDYPVRESRLDAFTSPWQWVHENGEKRYPWTCALTITEEQGLYDWRNDAMIIGPLLMELIQRLGGAV